MRRSPAPRTAPTVGSSWWGSALLVLGVAACGGDRAAPPQAGSPASPIQVAVAVPPLAWLVEAVGGDSVTTTIMVPAGTSHHGFEPAPRQLFALETAGLYVGVGHPAFLAESEALGPTLARRGVPLVTLTDAALATAAQVPPDDPHLWLSPPVMEATAEWVAAALSRMDAAGADSRAHRLAATRAEIDRVDREVRQRLAPHSGRAFLVYHPAWGAMAARYGLEQLAIESEGREPAPRQLVSLLDRARREGITTIFVQEGFSDRGARVLAAELGGRVVPLDPLPRDWPAGMRRTAEAIAASLGSAPTGAPSP
ncbi:MAG TPA: zinc ABC transporter substrate-binding protein [Thermoanaerobaculia bacterium]|nr:zinc ABC transporter substrate-binding protein [Thermoanaerobaculia bacterium]